MYLLWDHILGGVDLLLDSELDASSGVLELRRISAGLILHLFSFSLRRWREGFLQPE